MEAGDMDPGRKSGVSDYPYPISANAHLLHWDYVDATVVTFLCAAFTAGNDTDFGRDSVCHKSEGGKNGKELHNNGCSIKSRED
jgi:hypothetical protein